MNWFWLSLLYLLVHFSFLSLIWLVENCLAAKFAWLLSYCERLGRKKKDTYARTQTQSEFRNRENNENPKYKYYLATEYTQAPIHRNAMTTCIHQYTRYTRCERQRAQTKRENYCVRTNWQRACENNLLYVKGSCVDELSTDTERNNRESKYRQIGRGKTRECVRE